MKLKLRVMVTESHGAMGTDFCAGTDFNGQHFARRGKTFKDAVDAVKQSVKSYIDRQQADVVEEEIDV
jgi:hypothetical protein